VRAAGAVFVHVNADHAFMKRVRAREGERAGESEGRFRQ